MILLTITKPRKKANLCLALLLLVVLIGILIPSIYGMMIEADSLQRFASTDYNNEDYFNVEEKEFPGDPIRVNATVNDDYWQMIFPDIQHLQAK